MSTPRMPYSDEQLGARLAEGATAEIYEWGIEHILKLYRPSYGLRVAQYEARIARLVEAAGLDVPAVGDLIQVEARVGLVYERLNGQTAISVLQANMLRMRYFAKLMARLQANIHQQQDDTLPAQKDHLHAGIEQGQGLDDRVKDTLLKQLAKLPNDNAICHGDFHMENILINGADVAVIDWIDAVRGHPLGDIARSYVLMIEHRLDETSLGARLFAWGPRRWFRTIYVNEYFKLSGYTWSDLAPWLPIVAAARLREQVAQDTNLAQLVHNWLKE